MDPLRPTGDAAADVAALRAWLAEAEPRPLLIETSGSTGRPKRVLLSRDAVLASARASASRLAALGAPEGRWGLVLPSAYVAGVQVVVRSLVAGHDPQLGGHDDADFTSLVPTQLHRALDDPAATDALSRLRAVLVGGGPLDPSLRARAEEAGIRVVATYGASETAGGCVYDGHPLDGVAVVVGADGRVRIGGPTLFSGYLDDPGLTAEALVDGWYVTSDAGRIDEDGRLRVLGRVDDVVVSGGVKVPLPAVAAALRTHPGLAAAECVGVPDDEWGTRVVAVVVPAGEVPPDLGELRGHVAATHPRSWAPRAVVPVEELPLLGNGKVDRARLEVLAGA